MPGEFHSQIFSSYHWNEWGRVSFEGMPLNY